MPSPQHVARPRGSDLSPRKLHGQVERWAWAIHTCPWTVSFIWTEWAIHCVSYWAELPAFLTPQLLLKLKGKIFSPYSWGTCLEKYQKPGRVWTQGISAELLVVRKGASVLCRTQQLFKITAPTVQYCTLQCWRAVSLVVSNTNVFRNMEERGNWGTLLGEMREAAKIYLLQTFYSIHMRLAYCLALIHCSQSIWWWLKKIPCTGHLQVKLIGFHSPTVSIGTQK